MNKKVLLLILDGWGITQNPKVSAIAQADTPYMDQLLENYPNAALRTDGGNVGLPDGQMGNSEVGHINLGAGRIIYQELARINRAVEKNTLEEETVLKDAFEYALENNRDIHCVGLLSDGGVHSHIDHLKGILSAAAKKNIQNIFVHAFTDGRDVDPHAGKGFVKDLQNHMQLTSGKIASVIGRYFAMDRDKRWERTKKAYDLLVHAKGSQTDDILHSIQKSYDAGISDEFLDARVLTENGLPVATIKKNDVVLFFNFRTDRGRQLTEALTQREFPEQHMHPLPLHYVTMTNYDDSYANVKTIYHKENVTETLGEVISLNGKKQIRIAETEKYPHVTFFFSGGREEPFEGETRIMCNSPKVATYNLKPEMSAYDLRDKILPEIKAQSADFICMNLANPDMVGHTGDFQAAIKACEAVDKCVRKIVDAALENNYTTLLIADHGNSEVMINEDGSPNTAHTTNPVPIIVIDREIKTVKNGILADIAPTVLKLMGLPKPTVMDRESLI